MSIDSINHSDYAMRQSVLIEKIALTMLEGGKRVFKFKFNKSD